VAFVGSVEPIISSGLGSAACAGLTQTLRFAGVSPAVGAIGTPGAPAWPVVAVISHWPGASGVVGSVGR